MKRKGVLEHVYNFQRKRIKLAKDATHQKILNLMQRLVPGDIELCEILRHNYDTYEEVEMTFREDLRFSYNSPLLKTMTCPSYWLKDRTRIEKLLKKLRVIQSVTNYHFYLKAEVDNRGVLASYFGDDSFSVNLSKFMKNIKTRYLRGIGDVATVKMQFSFFVSFI